jgi:hypothetical protein
MNLSKLVRTVGLCLPLSLTALSATYADQKPLQPCGCTYCSHVPNTRECVNFDGTTMTCGYFLAVTFCLPNNG